MRRAAVTTVLMLALASAVGVRHLLAVGTLRQIAEFSAARGLADWDLDGSGTWAVRDGLLLLEREGIPSGPIRRPGAMAIFRHAPVRDFTAEVELRSTAPVDLLVRDVLLIFAYQSPTRFYYVHLSAKTDGVHNGIFLVHDADRRRLDPLTSSARLTDHAWHRVRLERVVSTGSIRVFFDDDPNPVLSATDTTLMSGRVGVGSFDETADFRRFTVR
jgi:hypothetical protein